MEERCRVARPASGFSGIDERQARLLEQIINKKPANGPALERHLGIAANESHNPGHYQKGALNMENHYCSNCDRTMRFLDLTTFLVCEHCSKRLERAERKPPAYSGAKIVNYPSLPFALPG